MAETIRYSLIGLQDLRRGTSSFEATLADGRVVTLDEINISAFLAKGADIASAAELTIPAGISNYHDITGTTTVTSISTKSSGYVITFQFDGILTLTHNATSLILQGAANFTTAAGDVISFISEGDGNWRELSRRLATGTFAVLGENTFTGTQHWDKGADVASASTLAPLTDGNYFDVTGTTGITGLGTQAIGTIMVLQFDGILTLTHNATSLILQGAANFTTAAGDVLQFISEGDGNWRELSRSLATGTFPVLGENTFTGTQHWDKGADVASASTLAPLTDGNYFDVTGTTGITGLGTQAIGTIMVLQFDGAVTLTHNATSLILTQGADFTTAAGDTLMFISEGSGNWREIPLGSHASSPALVHGLPASVNVLGNRDASGEFIVRKQTDDITTSGAMTFFQESAAATFGITFSATPIVLTGGCETDVVNFTGAQAVTTTGFRLRRLSNTNTEAGNNIGWIALGT